MFKKNPSKNRLIPHAGFTAKSVTVIAVKSILILMAAAGFALASLGAVLLLNNGTKPAVNNAAMPQSALAVKASGAHDPSLLTIPSLNLSAPFELLGLNPNHTIEVPKNNMGVGWFVYGAKPGEIGATVVVGHLDSVKGRAIFADLDKIKPGDKILIKRADGSEVAYRVDSLSKFSQDSFPTLAVYGTVSYPAIRLITCAGIYDKKAGHYSENLVVFGSEI
jgi:LPXTG-site transpeptidase (sortase) family protein